MLTIAEIPLERQATQKLPAFSGPSINSLSTRLSRRVPSRCPAFLAIRNSGAMLSTKSKVVPNICFISSTRVRSGSGRHPNASSACQYCQHLVRVLRASGSYSNEVSETSQVGLGTCADVSTISRLLLPRGYFFLVRGGPLDSEGDSKPQFLSIGASVLPHPDFVPIPLEFNFVHQLADQVNASTVVGIQVFTLLGVG